MVNHLITITRTDCFRGRCVFKKGMKVTCVKEPLNPYDREAIRCELPGVGCVGYVANSVRTVAVGTNSAGRIYDKVKNRFVAVVESNDYQGIVCRVTEGLKSRSRHPRENVTKAQDAYSGWIACTYKKEEASYIC